MSNDEKKKTSQVDLPNYIPMSNNLEFFTAPPAHQHLVR